MRGKSASEHNLSGVGYNSRAFQGQRKSRALQGLPGCVGHPALNKTLGTTMVGNLCKFLAANEWNRLLNCWLFEGIKHFQIKKFLGDFPFRTIRFLNALAFCMKAPYTGALLGGLGV